MTVQIQMRRGTTTQWSTANPTLAEGEVGVDTTLTKFKVGNGSTAWNSLGYATLTFRNAYAGGTTYYSNDIITYLSQTYICILQSTGNLPTNTTYWSLLAAKGTDGTNGEVTLSTAQTLTNKTLTSPNINGGVLNNTSTISDGTTAYSIGYRNMPKSGYVSSSTLDTADIGKFVYQTGGSVVIPADATANLTIGTVITVVNSGTTTINIQIQTGGTLRQADTTATGNRTLSSYGIATILKVDANTWFITGAGVA